jgi:hypothetical protein
MRKERPYAFFTTNSMRVEVKASSAQQAHRKAKEKWKGLRDATQHPEWFAGEVTTSYTTFGKSGFAPVGMNKQVRPIRGGVL